MTPSQDLASPAPSIHSAPSASPRLTVFILGFFMIFCALGIIAPRTLSVSVPLLGLLGTLSVMLGHWRSCKKWIFPSSRSALIFATGLVVLAGASSLWANNFDSALERTFKMIGPVLGGALLFGLVTYLDRDLLRRAWWVIPALWLGMTGYVLADYLSSFALYRMARGIDPAVPVYTYELNRSVMALGLLALPALALISSRLRFVLKGRRFAWSINIAATLLLAGPFFFVLLVETSSQSAQVGFLCGVILLCFWPGQWRPLWDFARIGTIAALLAFPFVIPPLFNSLPPVAYQAGEQGNAWHNRANVMPRLEVWDYISRYALQRPLTGYGIEATRNVTAFDTQEIYQPGKTNLHPHNAILQIWIEFGLIGIVLTAATCFWLLRRVQDHQDIFAQRLSLSVFVAIGIMALVGYGLWQGWWLGLVGLSAFMTRMALYSR